MAKIETASPEIVKLVQDITMEMGLSNYVNFLTFNIDSQKEVVKLQIANNVVKKLTEKEVVILVYEDAFDKVDEKTKYSWLRMALDNVVYDYEKDKVSISNQTISIPIGYYHKFGNIAVQQAELAILTIQEIEDERKRLKAEEKAAKKNKRRH